jgi:probable F420-dependent oxidoreductase
MPRLCVTLESTLYPVQEQHRLIDVARAADEMGIDYIDTTEHVLMGLNALTAGQGWEPHHLEMPQTEVLTTLAAFAGATRRIKLLSGIVIAPLRPAGLLAKTAATLHALSQGRFVMGVTASWQKDEYDALGVDFARRGEILDDTIAACRVLWEQAPASFHSAHVNFDGMFCSPRPAADERIPIWFGGKFTPRQVRRIVTWGDGWMPYGGHGMSLQQKADAIATLRDRFLSAGRDASRLEVCDGLGAAEGQSSLERTMERIPALAEIGVTVVRVNLRRFSRGPEELFPTLERAVRLFEPFRAA